MNQKNGDLGNNMGKFRTKYSMFWKHSNCLDVFFAVDKVSFDEDGKHATVHGVWMIQGVFKFWPASWKVRLNIKPDQYDSWQPYEPRGELYV